MVSNISIKMLSSKYVLNFGFSNLFWLISNYLKLDLLATLCLTSRLYVHTAEVRSSMLLMTFWLPKDYEHDS